MQSSLLYVIGVLAASAAPGEDPEFLRFEAAQVHMGVRFKIVLYAADEAMANRAVGAAFARVRGLDRILSDYDPVSELNCLCREATPGEPAHVGDDLWRVLREADRLSKRSGGAFDVTVGPLTKLWRLARQEKKLPANDQLAAARKSVGFQFLRLDAQRQTVTLLRPEMQLDLGGIAKGYAADAALAVLRENGIRNALVDAGGDIALGDAPPGTAGWRIGVAPLQPQSPPSRILQLANCAVATSGDAWQFVEVDGRRYSHIVDPKTGLGLTDRSSVTVVAPDCTTADALASAVSVLGPDKGLELVDQNCGAAALIVRAPDGTTDTRASRRFERLPAASIE